MKDPILDQKWDTEPISETSWSVTTLWVFLLLTGTNILIYYGLGLLTPYFTNQIQESARSAGEVIALIIAIRMASVLVLSLAIGIWWGRLLAKNRELPNWQTGVIAFGVALVSFIARLIILGFKPLLENLSSVFPHLFFLLVFEIAIFAAIVFATATYRRGKGWLPGILASILAIVLIMGAKIVQNLNS